MVVYEEKWENWLILNSADRNNAEKNRKILFVDWLEKIAGIRMFRIILKTAGKEAMSKKEVAISKNTSR